jgi:adenylate cyclase
LAQTGPVARLIIEQPFYQEFLLGDLTRMGRSPDSDILFEEDTQVSREHARIQREGDNFFVQDLQSRNGVSVNHQRITGRTLLKDGDLVTLGQTTMRFSCAAPAPRASAAKTEQSAPTPENKTIIAEISANQELFSVGNSGIQDLQKAANNLKIIYSVSEALAGNLDLDRVLDDVLEKIFEVVKADRGVVFLVDPKGKLRRAAQKARGQKVQGEIPVSQSILNHVLNTQCAVLTTDAMKDDRFADGQSIMMQNIQSAACVPLICRKKVLGVLQVESTQRAQAFSRDDLQLLTGIGGQAAIAVENASLLKKAEEEAEIRTNLQRYLAPQIAQQVIEKKISLSLGGQAQKITILFSDMRGFTKMTEEIGASEIVKTLNEYFERMVAVIFRNQGTLDKFVGDAIMALWGVPIESPDDPYHSVRAAVEMQRELFMLNLWRRMQGQRPLYMGIGLNTGEAVVGNMGASNMMQYTAMGGAVNQASRIESKTQAGQVLLSASTLQEVNRLVRTFEMQPVELKGFANKVPIWTVTGLVSDDPMPTLAGLGQPTIVVTYMHCTHGRTRRTFIGRGFDREGEGYGVALSPADAVDIVEGDVIRVHPRAVGVGESIPPTPIATATGTTPLAALSEDAASRSTPLAPLMFKVSSIRVSPPERQPPFVVLNFLSVLDTQH